MTAVCGWFYQLQLINVPFHEYSKFQNETLGCCFINVPSSFCCLVCLHHTTNWHLYKSVCLLWDGQRWLWRVLHQHWIHSIMLFVRMSDVCACRLTNHRDNLTAASDKIKRLYQYVWQCERLVAGFEVSGLITLQRDWFRFSCGGCSGLQTDGGAHREEKGRESCERSGQLGMEWKGDGGVSISI